MAQGDAREGKWRGNRRMEWVASTLHTTSEHGVSNITNADTHTSAASSRLNWRPRRFKWTRPFRRKTKSGFCACAITYKTESISSDRKGYEDILSRDKSARINSIHHPVYSTRYSDQDIDWIIQSLKPGWVKRFFSSPKLPPPCGAYPSSYSMGTGGSSLGGEGKMPVCEVDYTSI